MRERWIRILWVCSAVICSFGSLGASCLSPQPPACRVATCARPQARICDLCVNVADEGQPCFDLCDPNPMHPRCRPLAGLACVSGVCRQAAKLGQACNDPTQPCVSELYCLNSGDPACAGAPQLAPTFSHNVPPQHCEPYRAEGDACDSVAGATHCIPCMPGLACLAGVCHRSCASDRDCPCSSSHCVGGQCTPCVDPGRACTTGGTPCCSTSTTCNGAICCLNRAATCDGTVACCGADRCQPLDPTNPAGSWECLQCITRGAVCRLNVQCCAGTACDSAAGTTGRCCPFPLGSCHTGTTCDTHLYSDSQNCGRCGNVCRAPNVPNGVPVCRNGSCTFACATGFFDCDDDFYRANSNGCESSTTTMMTDNNNCGYCHHQCSTSEGFSCVGGRCLQNNQPPPTGSGTCEPYGTSCTSTAQCCQPNTGQLCINGYCDVCAADGELCASDRILGPRCCTGTVCNYDTSGRVGICSAPVTTMDPCLCPGLGCYSGDSCCQPGGTTIDCPAAPGANGICPAASGSIPACGT